MADYYTQASFIIPCTKEQANLAVEALKQIDGECTYYAKEILSKDFNEIIYEKDIIIRQCFKNHPDREDGEESMGWDFSVEAVEEGIFIHPDESINTEHAAIFTQAVLTAFNLPHLITILAAHTCNLHRANAFGGHACAVTQNFIRWADLSRFTQAEIKAHGNGERYFVCDITEINGEYEYTSQFLMKCMKQETPERRLDDIFVTYRGDDGGDKESDSFVWYECGTAAKNPNLQEITPF